MQLTKLLAAGLLCCTLSASAAEPLPMPAREAPANPATLGGLANRISELNRHIGSYPPRFADERQRNEVYGQWSEALRQAWQFEDRMPQEESTFAVLADLYRQGHNLDVAGADRKAIDTLANCLARFPNSAKCHMTAAYFYLSINPSYAPKGEASLLRLRELLKTHSNPEVERGLVFAYLYQQKTGAALAQLDHYLALVPDDAQMRKLREGIANKRAGVKSL